MEPKDEQKKHLIDMMRLDEEDGIYEEPNQALKDAAERLKGKELFKESNDRARKILSEIKSLPIQETLEEAAENHAKIFQFPFDCDPAETFINGAKWQQKKDIKELKPNPLLMDEVGHWDFRRQRSYSEEEVKDIMAETWIQCVGNDGNDFKELRDKILEQFKKD